MHLSRFRPQFTVRRLMSAVAIVALMIWASARALRQYQESKILYEKALIYHRSNAAFSRFSLESEPPIWVPTPPPSQSDLDYFRRQAEYHEAMVLKYERAVRYPWFPVSPDPPVPE